jgi:alpha-tubulin suppressor-like RCC1 family protein
MLIFSRSASRRGVAACLCIVAPALVASACTAAAPGPERTGRNASAVWGFGENGPEDNPDVDDLPQNIVVSLAKTATGPSACTGTLLTPRLVITAASCANDGKAGPLPFVRVGGRVPFTQVVQASSFVTANTPSLEPSLSGKDIGVVFLQAPVLESAHIHHPPFIAPTAGPVAQGGLEGFANIGVAGWSSLDPGGGAMVSEQNARQAFLSNPLSMWRYWRISSGQEPFWVYSAFSDGSPKDFGLAPGDDGGPLFVLDNGHRNIIGVASIIGAPLESGVRSQNLPALQSPSPITGCDPPSALPGSVTSCTAWVDVTNATVKAWLLGKIADTTRGPTWLAMHPRVGQDQGTELWIGDVDYTGPCTPATDTDCDHTWTRNTDGSLRDNCPDVANIDQLDKDDGGAGDACACPAGQIGVHEADFSNQKVCVGIGVKDVSSANSLQSVSVPQDRDAIVCPQPGQSGACVLRQHDWLATGTLRTAGIHSAVVLDRNRTVLPPPDALVQHDTAYTDADYATIDTSAYSGKGLDACYERCTADARCDVLTFEGSMCHLKSATPQGGGISSPGSTSVRKRASQIGQLSIGFGSTSTCALMTGGGVRCAGANSFGQLGDGTRADRSLPLPVAALGSWVRQIAVGSTHACALMNDGSVQCWGENGFGQLGDGDPTIRFRSVPGPVPSLGTSVSQIAAGFDDMCALMNDGSARCWGNNNFGQLGDGTVSVQNVPVTVKIASNNIKQIAAGSTHACALLTDNSVRCWGSNSAGQLGDGSTVKRSLVPVSVPALGNAVSQLALGAFHSCARMNDGSLRCWGYNASGQLGDGSTTNRNLPISPSGIPTSVSQMALGTAHTCVLTIDGGLRCWGSNNYGDLGDGSTTNRSLPGLVTAGGIQFKQVASGWAQTCALANDGSVRCWGYNGRGSFGDGSTTSSPIPVMTQW